MKGNFMRKLLLGTLAMLITSAPTAAQTTSPLVGTWAPVTITNVHTDGTKTENFGPKPDGIIVFTAGGRFSFIECDPALVKIAANNRNGGTADENKTIVQRSLSYYGTYKDDPTNKAVTMRIFGGSYANWKGTDQVRTYTLVGDTLTLNNPNATVGGKAIAVFKRLE
jgi:hypothetical protein